MKRTKYTATLTEGSALDVTVTAYSHNGALAKARDLLRDLHEPFTINHDGTYTGDRTGRIIRITITHE